MNDSKRASVSVSGWFQIATLAGLLLNPGVALGAEGVLGDPPPAQQASGGDAFTSPMTLVEIGPQPGKSGVVSYHLVESASDAWKLAEGIGLRVTVVAGPFDTRSAAANEAKKRGLLSLRITTIDRDGKEDTSSANQLALALADESFKPGNRPLTDSITTSFLPGGFGMGGPPTATGTSAAPPTTTLTPAAAEEGDGKRATILSFSGKVTVRFKTGEEMAVTQENFGKIKLRRGDKVITGYGATLKIQFFDGSTGDVGEGELTL